MDINEPQLPYYRNIVRMNYNEIQDYVSENGFMFRKEKRMIIKKGDEIPMFKEIKNSREMIKCRLFSVICLLSLKKQMPIEIDHFIPRQLYLFNRSNIGNFIVVTGRNKTEEKRINDIIALKMYFSIMIKELVCIIPQFAPIIALLDCKYSTKALYKKYDEIFTETLNIDPIYLGAMASIEMKIHNDTDKMLSVSMIHTLFSDSIHCIINKLTSNKIFQKMLSVANKRILEEKTDIRQTVPLDFSSSNNENVVITNGQGLDSSQFIQNHLESGLNDSKKTTNSIETKTKNNAISFIISNIDLNVNQVQDSTPLVPNQVGNPHVISPIQNPISNQNQYVVVGMDIDSLKTVQKDQLYQLLLESMSNNPLEGGVSFDRINETVTWLINYYNLYAIQQSDINDVLGSIISSLNQKVNTLENVITSSQLYPVCIQQQHIFYPQSVMYQQPVSYQQVLPQELVIIQKNI